MNVSPELSQKSDQNAPAQMSRHQLGLVDNSFEEGHYDSGIAVLNQLRSPSVTPSVSHIRQLLYLALYPPQSKEKPLDPQCSPSKVSRQRSQQLVLSPETISSAQTLLTSFAYTNDPRVISRALPSYDGSKADTNTDGDDADSFVAQESLRISCCPSCWHILSKKFIPRVVITSPTKSKRKRRKSTVEDDDSDVELDASSVVADNAWPILEWLITLFERDEHQTELSSLPRYSPLLLSQIPSPRSGNGARWDADMPLAIILYALGQAKDERRQSMGARLLHLLINLTSTIYFDFSMFVTQVFNKIATFMSQEFLALLATLPSSRTVLKFKIALLHKFISTDGRGTSKVPPRPKPQARARPTRRGQQDEPVTEGSSGGPANAQISISSNPALPTSVDIMRSLNLQLKHSLSEKLPSRLWINFQLLASYGDLQAQVSPDAKDEGWVALLHSGEFVQQLRTIFQRAEDDPGDAEVYQELLKGLAIKWVQ